MALGPVTVHDLGGTFAKPKSTTANLLSLAKHQWQTVPLNALPLDKG